MKKRIFLILFIILIVITILAFIITNSDTYSESAEEYFSRINKNNENTQQIADNSIFSEPKEAEDGNLGEVTRKIKEGTVTNSGVTLIITNRTNVKFSHSAWFSIEEKENDKWVAISSKEDMNGMYEIYNTIMPNKSVELKLDWSKVYGTLKKRRI